MTKFLGRSYASPIWLASGTFGWGVEAWRGGYFPGHAGALVTKGVSPKLMEGGPQPRIAEVGQGVGLLNAIGLQNPGVEGFMERYVPEYESHCEDMPIWVNVFADSIDGFSRVVERVMQRRGAWLAGFEVNVSCPNVDKGGAEFAQDPEAVSHLLKQLVSRSQDVPLMVKLSPMTIQAVDFVKRVQAEGAQAISVANTMLAGFPEPEKRSKDGRTAWALGRRYGGYSGAGLKPIALRMLDQISRAVDIPICGVGGIQNGHDVWEYLSAGATVVQVGTANFSNPWIVDTIWQEWQSLTKKK